MTRRNRRSGKTRGQARGRNAAQGTGGGSKRPKLKKVGGKRLPARSSSARDAKRDENLVRLNKFLADNGVASRRASDELIASGKVLVDEDIVTELGTKIDPSTQVVDVNGVRLRSDPRERRYYILHKPAGVVCTNEMRETRPRAIDLITDPGKGRIFTVGRLDEESKGLLLLTSDGEFAERIAHPRFGVMKTYLVKVPDRITDEAVQKIRQGVHLAEGRTGGARILVKRRTASGSTLEITIQEGKNREVRRVFARVGHKVVSLTRTSIGPLGIRGLKEGRWRALSRDEVEALLRMSDRAEDGSAFEDQADGTYEGGDGYYEAPRPARRLRASTSRSTGKYGPDGGDARDAANSFRSNSNSNTNPRGGSRRSSRGGSGARRSSGSPRRGGSGRRGRRR